ncbi:MAG TPA: pyridoxamine 5'-phosphate oxidase family protein [Candidatus Sulfotelmatobacter sp.]|nr:pyridoxamine 5'-phosphate oxidase family protein [Candidatus Sulfotelmatobacter sp.]
MSRPIFTNETPQGMAREQMVAKVGELIKDINIAMLTTEAEDGLLHSRPMATQKTEFDGTLWFFTGLNTGKISEIDWNPEVNLSYAEASDNRYVSVSGTAEIVDDRAKMEELWSDIYKAWFPQGLDDPDLCLMKVEVTFAEYWDVPSGKMVQVFGFLKALATDERLKMEGGSHGVVEIPSGKARAAVVASANPNRDSADE